MRLSLAIEAFLLDKRIAGCSPNTLRNYRLSLRRFCEHFGSDPELSTITSDDVRAFLDKLSTTRIVPAGVAPRPERQLSAKTIKNVHICLCSLWTWAIAEGCAATHIVHDVEVANASTRVIEPFTQEQIKKLLDATSHSMPWDVPARYGDPSAPAAAAP